MTGRAPRRTLLVALPALLVMLPAVLVTAGGCGAQPAQTVGEYRSHGPGPVPAAAATTSQTSATSGSASDVDQAPVNASSQPWHLSGAGTYVLDTSGVVATMRIPADSTQEDVSRLKSFLRRTHSPSLLVVSVTVTNRSSTPFSVRGLRLLGSPEPLPLHPVAAFVNLAVARGGVAQDPQRVHEGSIIALTSVTTIPAGAEVTTLVATQARIDTITGVVYQPEGHQPVALRPLWQIRQEAARLAREQERKARELARRQAADARRRAHQSGAGGA